MSLSSNSIQNAIAELKAYRDSLDAKTDKLLEKLAYIGVKEASVRFTTAMYDGVNDSSVTLEPITGGYCIKAEGKAKAASKRNEAKHRENDQKQAVQLADRILPALFSVFGKKPYVATVKPKV